MSTHNAESHLLPTARADGVTTLLSGWGGDELSSFNGRAVGRHLLRHGRWPTVWRHVGQRVRIRAGGPVSPTTVAREFAGELRNNFDPRRRRAFLRSPANLDQIAAVSPLAAETITNVGASLVVANNHHDYQLGLLALGHMQHRCGWWYQTGQLFGIDYRYPLLDLGVVTAALQLPWWAYRSQGWNRLAFRRAVEQWVPASVAWNVLKNEPAMFAVHTEIRGGGEGYVAGGRRHRPEGDDAYQRLVDLLETDTRGGEPVAPQMDIVITRPKAAPPPI